MGFGCQPWRALLKRMLCPVDVATMVIDPVDHLDARQAGIMVLCLH
jgi:hypothetical protein